MRTKNEYGFNPHRHVKIWLSKNPQKFMSDENQLRLLAMRSKCPGDEIHLIYDSRLLTNDAKQDLLNFCKNNGIQADDIRDLINNAQLDSEEKQLIEIYEDEISHLDAGGNLAAASDVLRWIRPVYQLGTYSDFDVNIKTKDLPDYIPVKSDILLNIGSHQLFAQNELIDVCNDIISITSPDSEKIKKIQKAIIVNCKPRTIKELLSYSHTLEPDVVTYLQQKNPRLITPRQFRANLDNLMNPIIREVKRILECKGHFSELDSPEKYMTFFKKIEHRLYIDSVVGSTGPVAIVTGLDLPNTRRGVSYTFIEQNIKPMSFEFNHIVSQAFASIQKLELHASKDISRGMTQESDLSWTAEGQAAMARRERTLHNSATKIQAKYKNAVTRLKTSKNHEDTGHDIKPK